MASSDFRVLMNIDSFWHKLLIPKPVPMDGGPGREYGLTLDGLRHFLEVNRPDLVQKGIFEPQAFALEVSNNRKLQQPISSLFTNHLFCSPSF